MKKKIVIIGGVAGGATAATRLRRLSEEDEIIVIEKGKYVSFANCGLPYYIGGIIKDRARLFEETPETLKAKFNLDVRTEQEAISFDPEAKTIRIRKLSGEEYGESFDKLIISTGASPRQIPLEGLSDAQNVFYLRSVDDADAIHDFIGQKAPKAALVVGGGFIGIEAAENLIARGVKVTLVETKTQIMSPFDPEMAAHLQNEMSRNGVIFKLGRSVSRLEERGRKAVLDDGQTIDSDMTLLSLGVVPDSALAVGAGLKTTAAGYIETNEMMQVFSSASGEANPDVFAIGDVAAIKDYIDGSLTHVALAGLANRQGRLAADVIHGLSGTFKGALGTSIVKVFGLVGASTGHSEAYLSAKGAPHRSVIVTKNSHAGYYPGAAMLSLKIIFDPKDGTLLGAQAVGADGADKRIDVLATAIKAHMNVVDLTELELSYAPPFGTAKDIVNIAGYVAENLLQGQFSQISLNELEDAKKDALLIDARTPLEYGLGHIDGAVNLPFETVRSRLAGLPSDKSAKIIVYCNVGLTAYLLIRVLVNLGYDNVSALEGGYRLYEALKENQAPATREAKETSDMVDQTSQAIAIDIDATGLQCPGPIMQAALGAQRLNDGQTMRISASDCGFSKDIASWCQSTGNSLLSNELTDGKYVATVRKGAPLGAASETKKSGKTTIVLFSGDMDKAMASLIIAQGTRAMGNEATVFCTFWGLNLLRKGKAPKVKKSAVEKAFGAMMPKGAAKMGISKMNFLGLGAKMMKSVMKKKNVVSLPDQLIAAQKAGVRFLACTMSMDVMGIHKEELIDGIEYVGVATYLAESENAGITLFI